MKLQTPLEIVTASLLALAVVACERQGENENSTANPPPYAGAAELELGESHEFRGGHRVTVHDVEHRFQGTSPLSDEEIVALVVEVEFCAGATPLYPPYSQLLLFSEAPFEMQGTMTMMHSAAPPRNLGVKQPALDVATEVQPGQCVRGWVEYLDAYGKGSPTKLGFEEIPQKVVVIWSAAES